MKHKNKVALITGAAVGIGKAAAIQLASDGAKVAILDINEEKLSVAEKEIRAYTNDVIALKCDISDENEVHNAIEKIKQALGNIDILVNNAALWRCWASFTETSTDEWKKFIDINVMGTVYCTKYVLPDMLVSGFGRIINVASVAGVYGNANMVHYSATKGAIISMTRALAKEVSDKGVTVNAISPGSVTDSENESLEASVPSELSFMRRTGSPMENAKLISFLASDDASYISGQNIQIDGCRKKQ